MTCITVLLVIWLKNIQAVTISKPDTRHEYNVKNEDLKMSIHTNMDWGVVENFHSILNPQLSWTCSRLRTQTPLQNNKNPICSLKTFSRRYFPLWSGLSRCTCYQASAPWLSSVDSMLRGANEKLTVASDWFRRAPQRASRCSRDNGNIPEQDFSEGGKSCSASKRAQRTHSPIGPNSCSLRPGQRHEKITSC